MSELNLAGGASSALDGSVRARIAWLLEYEPTWFPEFVSGLVILLWSACVFLTDDIAVRGAAWIMPCLGLVFGPLRWWVLLRLWYLARACLAALGSIWWGWLLCAAAQRWGVVPMFGLLLGLLVLDLLTMGRFSLPPLRDLAREYRAWRGPR